MITPEMDKYSRMTHAAYNCAVLAAQRNDLEALRKAKDLHRKLLHKWNQARARGNRGK